VVGTIAGATVGILLARRQFLAEVCAPFVKAANAVPRIVLGSLFVILLGLGVLSKIATVVVMVFFAVFFEAFSGVLDIEDDLIQQAYLFGASRSQALTLRASSPG
jgi:NitT/TauT family transport system permease protein